MATAQQSSHPPPTLCKPPVWETPFPHPLIGMELKINRGNVAVDVGLWHANSGTVASCLSSKSWYCNWLAGSFPGSASGSLFFGGECHLGERKASRGLSVPTELQSGLISHLSGNSLPSDRLIAIWVVTKKEPILLAVCLANWNRFLKLYQNVIIPGFQNMPSGCEEDLQIP